MREKPETKENGSNNKIHGGVSYKTQIFVLAVLTIALVFLGWAYVLSESDKYRDNIIESYGASQQVLVDQVSKNVREGLATRGKGNSAQGQEQAEESVVENIIKKAEVSGSRYWFFYSSDGVIFEKDAEETRNVKGKSFSELMEYWKLQGGSGIENFKEIIGNTKSGMSVFSKNSKIGAEIVSIKFFSVESKEYVLGMATTQSYVLNTSRVNAHILYLWTFSALVSLNIIIFALMLCLVLYRNHRESETLNRSLVDKSLQIQELNRKLTSKSEAVENASIYDSLTRLYNRKFFDSLLSRVNHDLLMPVSVVIMDINGLSQLNVLKGYGAGDELLAKLAAILNKICLDTDVLARTGGSEFTILMTGTDEAEAYGITKNIKRQFASLDSEELTLSIGVAQMNSNDDSIFSTMDAALKNLVLEKLLDGNSNSSSIVSMLMTTLKAYSRETVSHSDRIREIAVSFGKVISLSPSQISRLAIAAQLHDVGKIGIPDNVLLKKGALSEQEKDLIRRHSEIGYNIVKAIPFLEEVAVDILQHHESYDGTGYPNGIRGDEISINARVINIIDSFDAMIHMRVYASLKTVEEAIDELRKKSGHQYDPWLVNEFIRLVANNFEGKEEQK